MGVGLVWALLFSYLIILLSACVLLHPRVPNSYFFVHVRLFPVSFFISTLGWCSHGNLESNGWWASDRLSWVVVSYIIFLGWIVLRFSIRFFQGDQSQRKILALLTWTVVVASVTWMGNDLRWIAVCWSFSLFGYVAIVMQKREWSPVKRLSQLVIKMFAASCLCLLVSIVILRMSTGTWNLYDVVSGKSLSEGVLTWVNGLILVASIIPGAQWPFHRWLLASVTVPTPVSAVMHAGLVNAGALLLTRFAPLFSGSFAQLILLIIGSVSVLLGMGILLVHVDYKRQLVASTITQMGVMFVQCAMDSYGLAVLHLILHGCFKAYLFLQSGSAVQRIKPDVRMSKPSPFWTTAGIILGIGVGLGYWLMNLDESVSFLRAVLLGWTLSCVWLHLGSYRDVRWTGFVSLAVFALFSVATHNVLMKFLAIPAPQPHPFVKVYEALTVMIFVAVGLIGRWVVSLNNVLSDKLYVKIVHLGEPDSPFTENHPRHLLNYIDKRG